MIDSVELLVNCYPKIRAYTDSCAVIPIIDRCRPVGSGLEILEHAHKLLMDSTLHHETRMTPDSTITMFITAVNKDGFPAKHQVVIFSDDFGMSKDNPYYYYFISFPTFSFADELRITINTYGTGLFDELNQRPNIGKFLQYNYIYPEPDVVTNGKIEYFSDEKIKIVEKNKGVVFQAVDIEAQNRHNRRNFIISVLIGTGFGLIIEILILLVRDLKREQEKQM